MRCFVHGSWQKSSALRRRVIVTLGNVPLQAVTNTKITIGEAHGRMLTAGETGKPLFALYHPASLIYNRALTPVYEQDVCELARCLHDGEFAFSDAK